MKSEKLLKIDTIRQPYRGIYATIAKKLGVTSNAVRQGCQLGNVRMMELVTREVRRRDKIVQNLKELNNTHVK